VEKFFTLSNRNQVMGIIADTLKLQLEELKRRDEQSQRETLKLIEDLRSLSKQLEAINFEEV
jgi:hypothetical protein